MAINIHHIQTITTYARYHNSKGPIDSKYIGYTILDNAIEQACDDMQKFDYTAAEIIDWNTRKVLVLLRRT